MAQDIVIGGRLHSAATGNTVAGANEILDDAKGKKQNVINQEVDNEIGSDSAAGTIKGRIKSLETAVGSGGSVDERIAETKAEIIGDAAADYNTLGKVEDKIQETKSEILGDAASDYNTLGKVEDKIQAETSRAEAAESALDNAKANKATTLEGYGIIDAYTKNETYTKTEVNGLVDTPHQNYVTVLTYAALIAIDPGSTDTIYRVSNYDGSVPQVDVTKYSEYAWDGTQYVFLCVKSQIDEVFDISVYNNNATYADLAAALGTDGANVPQTLRRGGMSVKYVQSFDNKYVQARCMAQNFTTDVTQWQGVDVTPVSGSKNIVESGGIAGFQALNRFSVPILPDGKYWGSDGVLTDGNTRTWNCVYKMNVAGGSVLNIPQGVRIIKYFHSNGTESHQVTSSLVYNLNIPQDVVAIGFDSPFVSGVKAIVVTDISSEINVLSKITGLDSFYHLNTFSKVDNTYVSNNNSVYENLSLDIQAPITGNYYIIVYNSENTETWRTSWFNGLSRLIFKKNDAYFKLTYQSSDYSDFVVTKTNPLGNNIQFGKDLIIADASDFENGGLSASGAIRGFNYVMRCPYKLLSGQYINRVIVISKKNVSNLRCEIYFWYNGSFADIAVIPFNTPFKLSDYSSGDEFMITIRTIDATEISLSQVEDVLVMTDVQLSEQSEWNNKQWFAFGTSMSDTSPWEGHAKPSARFPQFLSLYSGLIHNNWAVKGSMLTRGEDDPQRNSILKQIRIAAGLEADGNGNTQNHLANADLITIEGLVNDFAHSSNLTPIGSLDDMNDEDADNQTIYGGLYLAIKYCYEANPNATIILLTDTSGAADSNTELTYKNHLGYYLSDYAVFMQKAAQHMGCICIDAGNKSQINMFHTQYLYDTLHHNDLGGEQYAKTIWDELKNIHPAVKTTL